MRCARAVASHPGAGPSLRQRPDKPPFPPARQVSNGAPPDVARGRVEGNDRPNSELVAGTAGAARLLVPSSVPLSSPEASV
jgi:hypothetical protein